MTTTQKSNQPASPMASLGAEKAKLWGYIKSAREARIRSGILCELPGREPFFVQASDSDRVNLLAIDAKARRLIDSGAVEAIDFRTALNQVLQLTPQEASEMARFVLDEVEAIFKRSWAVRDRIDNCASIEELRGLDLSGWWLP